MTNRPTTASTDNELDADHPTRDGDPAATDHPTGEDQAEENAATDLPG
jgi:hypothetical protein